MSQVSDLLVNDQSVSQLSHNANINFALRINYFSNWTVNLKTGKSGKFSHLSFCILIWMYIVIKILS